MVDIELSERQKKTIGAALTLLSGGVIVAFIGLLIWCLVWSVNRFSAVFLPLAVAAVLALMLKPWHAWIMRRIGQRPIRAVFLLYLAIGLPLALFLFFFGTRILSEVSGLVRQAPIWWESAMEGVHTHLPAAKEFWGKHGLGEKFGTLLDQNSAAFSAVWAASADGWCRFGRPFSDGSPDFSDGPSFRSISLSSSSQRSR